MYRIGLAILACTWLACNGGGAEKKEEPKPGGSSSGNSVFSSRFTAVTLPYQLADTTLLSNKDTASVAWPYSVPIVPDTMARQLFGKTTGIRFVPLVKVEEKNKEAFYLVKAMAGSKKAALLVVMDKSGGYGATLPFLVPDDNETTSQTSSLDKAYTITKAITQRSGNDVTGEGKEVLSYDANTKSFSLEMTDLLNDNLAVAANPIDTFAKTNKWAGDYYINKKNLVAVRDGRYANQILVYIHTENSEGDCKGELKGEFVLTGSSTAVYRQGGDPCVLGLSFSGNSVSINEQSGCGNYRGLDCPLTGTFTRKKEEKPKQTNKNPKRPKPTNSVTSTH